MTRTPDYPDYCEDCIHITDEGEHLVGDVEGGCVEPWVSCAAGRDQSFLYFNRKSCKLRNLGY